MTSDLVKFLRQGELAERALYTDENEAQHSISVIFRKPFELTEPFNGFENARYIAICRTEDVEDAKISETLERGELGQTTYESLFIRGVMPDGAGVTRLVLSED